jgi:GGDEF domain-containing protein
MPDDPNLAALHRAVHCYHSALLAMANCLGDACPEIGGFYRHRLSRLRSRLAFDSSPDALEESCVAVEHELTDYAAKVSSYVAGHGELLRVALAAVADVAGSISRRQDFYGARLRQFATQMEMANYPEDAEHLREVIALQAAGLHSCVESVTHDMQSLVARMLHELAAVERRLKEVQVTDPVTGMMSRFEMQRQIDACKATGTEPVLLQFHLTGEISDEIAKQVAERLGSQFRHKDCVSRWTDTDFLVLFQGPAETGQSRLEQIMPWVAGKYVLDNGDNVQIGVEAQLLQPDLVREPA